MSLTPTDLSQTSLQTVAPFYFRRQKDGKYLITNEFGYYVYLDETEFLSYIKGEITTGPRYDELDAKLFIKNKAYEDRAVTAYNHKNSFLAYGPTLHMIVTTLRCNHKCKYCHAAVAPMTAKNMDMTQETAQKVVDTIFYTSSPSLTIEFQGWESLVNYSVVQFIVEYATMKAQALQKNLKFALVSNLTLMDEDKLTWLLDHGVDICTSLDGDKETHNWQRTWKEGNSYERVTHWIQRINEEQEKRWFHGYKIGALATWTKPGLKNYRNIVDSYVDLGLTTIGLRWLNPYGFAATERATLEYTLDEYFEFYKNAMDYILEKNKKGIVLKEMLSMVYLGKILNNTDSGFMDVRSPSGIAIGGVAYNYDGKVYASDESRMLGRMGIEDFLLTPQLETGEETYRAMANSDVTKIAVQSSTLDGLPGYSDHVYKPYLWVDLIYAFTQHGNVFSNFSKDDKTRIQISMLDYLFEKLADPENEKIFRSWINR
jgi:uncharacterized protein